MFCPSNCNDPNLFRCNPQTICIVTKPAKLPKLSQPFSRLPKRFVCHCPQGILIVSSHVTQYGCCTHKTHTCIYSLTCPKFPWPRTVCNRSFERGNSHLVLDTGTRAGTAFSWSQLYPGNKFKMRQNWELPAPSQWISLTKTKDEWRLHVSLRYSEGISKQLSAADLFQNLTIFWLENIFYLSSKQKYFYLVNDDCHLIIF